MIIVALVVCVVIVVARRGCDRLGRRSATRRRSTRPTARYAQPYNIRRAFRNAAIIVAIVGAVVAFSTLSR